MRQSSKEVVKLSTNILLEALSNVAKDASDYLDVIKSHSLIKLNKHLQTRSAIVPYSWKEFRAMVNNAKQRGLINEFIQGKERYIEITNSGIEKLRKRKLRHVEPIRSDRWDGRWRIVIFDVPNALNAKRDQLREALKRLGFYALQASVYVYPFECRTQIELIFLVNKELRDTTTYLVADIIEGEQNVIRYFLDHHILSPHHISRKS